MAHDEPAMTSPMIAKLEDNRNVSTANWPRLNWEPPKCSELSGKRNIENSLAKLEETSSI